MVERFNGRISEVVSQTRFASAAELETTLERYVKTYNQQIPQRALNPLNHRSPVQALKEWQQKKPELFKKRVYNQTGLDSYQGIQKNFRAKKLAKKRINEGTAINIFCF